MTEMERALLYHVANFIIELMEKPPGLPLKHADFKPIADAIEKTLHMVQAQQGQHANGKQS